MLPKMGMPPNHARLSKEVYKPNFRQYGQIKSRAGKRQREEKD
jgi:hypothetical protein